MTIIHKNRAHSQTNKAERLRSSSHTIPSQSSSLEILPLFHTASLSIPLFHSLGIFASVQSKAPLPQRLGLCSACLVPVTIVLVHPISLR